METKEDGQEKAEGGQHSKLSESKENAMGSFMREKLGVAPDFYSTLKDDDDWTFVVKLHALMESTTTHILVSHFGDERLATPISWMENGEIRKGRIAFIKALELLPENRIPFITKFSTLRNNFAHKVRNLPLTIDEYFEREKGSGGNGFFDALCALYGNVEIEMKLPNRKPIVLNAENMVKGNGLRLSIAEAVHLVTCDALKLDIARAGQPPLDWWEFQVERGQHDRLSISMPMHKG